MPDTEIDYDTCRKHTLLAFLGPATLVWETNTGPSNTHISDQPRRLGALLCELSFGLGKDGVWVRRQSDLAAALNMDAGDCTKAISKLKSFGLLHVEKREGGLWFQLTPSVLTCDQRSLDARAAYERLEAEQLPRKYPHLLPPSHDERRDADFSEKFAEANREAAVVGSVPTHHWGTPNCKLGVAQVQIGKLPTHELIGRAHTHAHGDSKADRQIANRNESGAAALGSRSTRRFRDPQKNRLVEQVDDWMKYETFASEAEREQSRRTWISRIRDFAFKVEMAFGDVKDRMRSDKVKKPLGLAFRFFNDSKGRANRNGDAVKTRPR